MTLRHEQPIAENFLFSHLNDVTLLLCQPRKVFLFSKLFRLETLQPRGQAGTPIPDLFGTDEPEGRVSGDSLGIVEIFVASQAALDGPPSQVGKGELRILPSSRVRQMLFDQFSDPDSLAKLTHQDQAAVRGDSGTLKIDLEQGIEEVPKRLVLVIIHWACTSKTS
jgi:hypothetical protein